MKLGQFVDLLLIIVVFLQSYKISQLEKLGYIKNDTRGLFIYLFEGIKKFSITALYFLVMIAFGIVISMIIDLSTDGLRFAGEYETYYWTDVFEWLGNLFK